MEYPSVDAKPDTSTDAEADSKPAERLGLVREVIEALTVAVVIAFTFKHYAFEAYKVPTGSMEPTIMGDADVLTVPGRGQSEPESSWWERQWETLQNPRGGDHIVVDKLTYAFRPPERFEVVVFRYPNNRTINYIKRVVGLGGETLFIVDGDLYVAPGEHPVEKLEDLLADGRAKIVRKPRGIQDSLFDHWPEIPPEDVGPMDEKVLLKYWSAPTPTIPGQTEWTWMDGVVRGQAATTSLLRFRHSIRDNREFLPVGAANQGGRYVVSDVRWRGYCEPRRQGGYVVFELLDSQHEDRISVRIPIEGESDKGEISIGARRVSDLKSFHLKSGQKHHLTLANVDNTLILMVNGEMVIELEYDHPLPAGFASEARQGLAFGVENADVAFSHLEVHRDIYYQPGRPRFAGESFGRFVIPRGSVFMLGDNSPSSKDSREWQRVTVTRAATRTVHIGDSEAVLDPSDLTRRTDNPWWDAGDGRKYFMDYLGNRIDITDDGPATQVNIAPSPFVPLDLIVGRAFAVFLPPARMRLVR